jgi:hypothetical protein
MKAIAVLGLLSVVPATAFAQGAIQFASAGGRVTDASGGVVAGAVVTARETGTNLSRATTTDAEGRFRFSYLRIGVCEITVAHPGFAEAKRTLTLTAGASHDLPIALSVAAAEVQIDVTAGAAVLETARSQIAGTVSRTEAADLPLNGRSFFDLALLVPGVSPTNTASTQLFPETSAAPGQGISVGSQRNFSNSFIVDGLSANDDAAGLAGTFYGLDVVDELQVVTSGGQAEFGRALGGYISVVTRSGGNEVHGDLYGYFRNQRLNAANALSRNRLPMTQAQFGAGLGGPVRRDRTFYFGNFERRALNQSGLTSIAAANVATINGRLASAGYRGPGVATGVYPNPVHHSTALAKLDHQWNRRNLFSVRYSVYDLDARNSRGAGALAAPSASTHLANIDHTIAAGNVFTISPRTVNETRGQFLYSDLKAPPSDPVGPAVSIAGVASFGTSSSSPTGRRTRLYEIVNNLSHQSGAHAVRAGANFLYNDCAITFPRAIRGSYAFSSLANFLAGVYNNSGFTQTFGATGVDQTNPNFGVYVQDEWKAHPRLTLNAGLRYDLQFLESISTDRNNASPRAGLAWLPGEARDLVVRASYGLFYDRVPLRALANALLSAGNTTDLANLRQIGVSLSPAQSGAPAFPNILAGVVPTTTLVNLQTMQRDMQNAYSQQAGVEIERRMGARGTLSAGYQHLRGLHLIINVNQNIPTCVASGNNNGCRPNPNYANNNRYSSLADSKYNAFHFSYVQRPVRFGHFRVSYSYSKAMNNVGEFFFSSPIDPTNIWRDWGRSDDDQRHRLVAQGAVRGLGFQLTGLFQYYSALPFNITAGTTTIQGTQARPIANGDFIPRNAGKGFNFASAGARISREFRISEAVRLTAMAESFNALNRANGVTRNGVFGTGAYPANPSATFGQTTSVGEPRSVQLALRLRF